MKKEIQGYTCDGQMDIFDFLEPEELDLPIKYPVGTIIWKTMKADIVMGKIESTWICNRDDETTYRGYAARRHEGHSYIIFWDDSDENIYTSFQDAALRALEWEKENREDVVIAARLYMKSIKEAEYYRENLGHEDYFSFYELYTDETCYFHYGCKFSHYLTDPKKIKKERKEFAECILQQEEYAKRGKYVFEKYNGRKNGKRPKLENMYKVKRTGEKWDYAAVGYAYKFC